MGDQDNNYGEGGNGLMLDKDRQVVAKRTWAENEAKY